MRKGKEKKPTRDGTGIEKKILSVHHPSTLVHWWVLVTLALIVNTMLIPVHEFCSDGQNRFVAKLIFTSLVKAL